MSNSAARTPIDSQASLANAGPWKLCVFAALICIVGWALSYAVSFLIAFIWAFAGASAKPDDAALQFIFILAGAAALQIFLLWIALRNARRDAKDGWRRSLGLVRIEHPLALLAATIAAAGFVAVLLFATYADRPDALAAGSPRPGAARALDLVMLLGLAPLAEELFFRGWLWFRLRLRWSPLAASLATSLLWLVPHASSAIISVILLIPLAVLLPLVRGYCGSTYATLLLHISWNASAAFAGAILLWLGLLAYP